MDAAGPSHPLSALFHRNQFNWACALRKAGRPQTRSGIFFELRDQTTELYEVDGVKYLLLGGGGAQQDPILPGRTAIKLPAGYPPDLYWKGQRPKEEYNYLLVDVQPGPKTNRFRPWSAEPFATVELFN